MHKISQHIWAPSQCWDPLSDKYTQSKDYLLPLSLRAALLSGSTSESKPRRAYLFDAGATVAVTRNHRYTSYKHKSQLKSTNIHLDINGVALIGYTPGMNLEESCSTKFTHGSPMARVLMTIVICPRYSPRHYTFTLTVWAMCQEIWTIHCILLPCSVDRRILWYSSLTLTVTLR